MVFVDYNNYDMNFYKFSDQNLKKLKNVDLGN
jgi:intein-encoded DNA endonuclease-like protein